MLLIYKTEIKPVCLCHSLGVRLNLGNIQEWALQPENPLTGYKRLLPSYGPWRQTPRFPSAAVTAPEWEGRGKLLDQSPHRWLEQRPSWQEGRGLAPQPSLRLRRAAEQTPHPGYEPNRGGGVRLPHH